MKAAFTLIPSESRRLIAKGVAAMREIKEASESGYTIICGGTTNGYVAQEILGTADIPPQKYTAGTICNRVLCTTDADRRTPFPIILYKGQRVDKTIPEALKDFHLKTVIIKGANAIDSTGKAGIISSGFDGGTMGATLGTAVSQGLKYIVPVGLEKFVASVEESCAWTGAKTLDYSMGADFGMFVVPNAVVVTELEALKILADVSSRHVASGGIGECAGAVVIVSEGTEEQVKKAIALVEQVKGEPALPNFKGTCKTCRYKCIYADKDQGDLPEWLRD
ncbi:MAG: hypothetical protein LLG97_15930 [Deltaproteobacteria bacterium]|nr:hypothetical protein [Deltaproteobacteria bacterium]